MVLLADLGSVTRTASVVVVVLSDIGVLVWVFVDWLTGVEPVVVFSEGSLRVSEVWTVVTVVVGEVGASFLFLLYKI